MKTKIHRECLPKDVQERFANSVVHRVFVIGNWRFVLHSKTRDSRTPVASAFWKSRPVSNVLTKNLDGAVIRVLAKLNAQDSETYAYENYAFLLKVMGIYDGMQLDNSFEKRPNCADNLSDVFLEFRQLLDTWAISMHSGYFFMEHVGKDKKLYEVFYKMKEHIGVYETAEEAMLAFFVHKYGDYFDVIDKEGMETACRRILHMKPCKYGTIRRYNVQA